MKAASLNELKKEIIHLDLKAVQDLCMRLAKYKKENKELLTYLLFEANDEQDYIQSVKTEIEEQFSELPESNLYLIKKSVRKILRIANKQIKYSGAKRTEVELRIFFCSQMKMKRIRMDTGTVLYNLYQQQRKKIDQALAALPEDLQFDYQHELEVL